MGGAVRPGEAAEGRRGAPQQGVPRRDGTRRCPGADGKTGVPDDAQHAGEARGVHQGADGELPQHPARRRCAAGVAP